MLNRVVLLAATILLTARNLAAEQWVAIIVANWKRQLARLQSLAVAQIA
jgi:hypothetical protein